MWGESDCIFLLADWVHAVRGVDLGAKWRMTYSSAGECQRITGYFTDPVGFMDAQVEPLGLERTDAPQPGDIAVCNVPFTKHPVGGVKVADNAWLFKGEEGTTTLHSKLVGVLAAWSVGYEG
ncbi:hypothetical protein DEM26_18245 [Thioclava sp. NG1]|nr:hypothetical protein DEM26_18245 [Thioclava sp. NG1]